MEKNLSIFNFNKLPKSFLLALVLMFIFEAVNVIFDNYFYYPPFESLRMKIKNEFSQVPGSQFDVLVFGDCYNIVGVVPSIIEEKTKRSCFNFSTHSRQTILTSYCMMRNYLDVCAKKPKYIIIGFIPDVSAVTKESIEKYDIRFMYDFKKGNIDFFLKEFGLGTVVKFLIPSVKHQDFFSELIKNYFRFEKIPTKKQIDNFVQSVYTDKGHYKWYPNAVYTGEFQDNGEYRNYSVSDFFSKYMKAILELTKEKNIKVLYLIPSQPPDRYEVYKKNGIVKKYADFLHSLEKEYEHLTLLNSQPLLNEKSLYADRTHLNGRGMQILGEFLSLKINTM